jgi:hypothetical protein
MTRRESMRLRSSAYPPLNLPRGYLGAESPDAAMIRAAATSSMRSLMFRGSRPVSRT